MSDLSQGVDSQHRVLPSRNPKLLAAEALYHGHEFVDRCLAIAGADRGAHAALGVVRQQLQGDRSA